MKHNLSPCDAETVGEERYCPNNHNKWSKSQGDKCSSYKEYVTGEPDLD